jgi:hypothetical protein
MTYIMKKLFFSLLTLLVFICTEAQTYYLDPVNGSNIYTPVQAQNRTTPWKNFAATRMHDITIEAGTRFSLAGGQYGPDMRSYNEIPWHFMLPGDKGWKGTEQAPIVIEAQPGQTPGVHYLQNRN